MLASRTHSAAFHAAKRSFSTATCLCGKKSREPWDKRFPVRAEDVGPDKKGGSEEMAKALPIEMVSPTGVYHRLTGEYIHVPEMVPEFVVPDLTGFELKPYVSYRVKEIKQNKLSPRDIFNRVYAADIEDDFRDGKIKVIDGKVHLSDGRIITMGENTVEESESDIEEKNTQ